MANPVIVNVVPAPGDVAKVLAPVRFSARSNTVEILRNTVTVHQGDGPVFYDAQSGLLPEEYTHPEFTLFALEGIQNNPSDRSIVGDELKIDKSLGVSQESLYLMGGLEAPADPDSAIMVEFTVRTRWADVTPDGDDPGVRIGLWARNSGVTVRFTGGVDPRAIEVWDASYSATSRPIVGGDPYRYVYDWDNQTDTYKLLWHPKADLVQLYRSTGQAATTPDDLIVDGKVSDFSTLAAEEQRSHQPWVFFGHANEDAISISYWSSVYLFNGVDTPLYDGVLVGAQEGVVRTDEACEYVAEVFPEDAIQPWSPLPSSFGTLGGSKRLDNQWLALRRDDVLNSIGFFREETQLDSGVVVFDFTFRGESEFIEGGTHHTGMEFYIDTGTKLARVALLFSEGISYMGIYMGGDTDDVLSYAAGIASWNVERVYRLRMDPAGQTILAALTEGEEGVEEQYLVTVATAGLPVSEMPGPGIGFLNNAETSSARGTLYVRKLRYAARLRLVDSYPVPVAWTSQGSGSDSNEDGVITLESDSQVDPFYLYIDEVPGDHENGYGVEFRARVKEYSIDGEASPIRTLPGAGVVINDGVGQIALLFADAGPPDEKIIFLAKSDTDYAAALAKIRAGDESLLGTYASVDWTTFHLYRFQRTVGGKLLLFIDNRDAPSIELEEYGYDYPGSETGQWQIRFGNVLAGALVKSQWALLQHNISKGLDFSISPREREDDSLRFNYAFNNIIEATDSV